MNSILVASDFSATSKNAMRYALKMAYKLKAKVIFIYVYAPLTEKDELIGAEVHADYLLQLKKTVDRMYNDTGLYFAKVESECLANEGSMEEEMAKVAEEVKPGLLIMAMPEYSKAWKQGNNPWRLIDNFDIPVLIIPELVAYGKINHFRILPDSLYPNETSSYWLENEIIGASDVSPFISNPINNKSLINQTTLNDRYELIVLIPKADQPVRQFFQKKSDQVPQKNPLLILKNHQPD
jgi:nucleotide-binding universal stress UspA family protein